MDNKFWIFVFSVFMVGYPILAIWDGLISKKRLKEGLEQERKFRKKISEKQSEEQEKEKFFKNRSERAKTVFFISSRYEKTVKGDGE